MFARLIVHFSEHRQFQTDQKLTKRDLVETKNIQGHIIEKERNIHERKMKRERERKRVSEREDCERLRDGGLDRSALMVIR